MRVCKRQKQNRNPAGLWSWFRWSHQRLESHPLSPLVGWWRFYWWVLSGFVYCSHHGWALLMENQKISFFFLSSLGECCSPFFITAINPCLYDCTNLQFNVWARKIFSILSFLSFPASNDHSQRSGPERKKKSSSQPQDGLGSILGVDSVVVV